jgi:hypothetical protein
MHTVHAHASVETEWQSSVISALFGVSYKPHTPNHFMLGELDSGTHYTRG